MKKNITAILFVASSLATQAQATTTIDLEDFTGANPQISNLWSSGVQVIGPYSTPTSDGAGTLTLAPIVDNLDSGHIHVESTTANTNPFIHGDVLGVYVSGTGSHDTFSFQSLDILSSTLNAGAALDHPNSSVTVRGYLGGANGLDTGVLEADALTMRYENTDGSAATAVATATIADSDIGTFDFLAADAGFGEVDYVEFFFSDFYRVKANFIGGGALEFKFDNIVVGDAISTTVVPVPAAAWLFGTGLIGLLSFGKRKQNSSAA